MKKNKTKYSDGMKQKTATQELTKNANAAGCSSFDPNLEEKEQILKECIESFEEARTRLGIKLNTDFVVAKKNSSENPILLEDVYKLVTEINPANVNALTALNLLFTIAQAWNEEDGFVPDLSDCNQDKWYPLFEYDKKTAEFVYSRAFRSAAEANGSIGFRFCFKSSARAAKFGKKFALLFNFVYLH